MCTKNLLNRAIFSDKSSFLFNLIKPNLTKNAYCSPRFRKYNSSVNCSAVYFLKNHKQVSRNYGTGYSSTMFFKNNLGNILEYNACNYSALPKSNSLTDEILKSKIAQNTPIGENTSSGNKEKEKDKWYSGKNAWKVGLGCLAIGGFFSCTGIILTFGQPQKDPEGNEVIDEFTNLPGWLAYFKRAIKEMYIFKKMIQDPSSEKLLPDPLKEPYYQPPYTLVIEMTGVLVHPDWTLSTGWRFKKRPGLKYFLQQIGPPLFEVVIYTHEQGFTAYPIIDSMDPDGRVMFRLFRDATRYVNGTHVKDLSFLNRDLSKVIIVDCDPKAMSLQPRNGFLLEKWEGDDLDRKLIDLANFLNTIVLSKVDDVRPVMEYYAQFDDPIAHFKESQKQLQIMEEERAKVDATKTQKFSLLSNIAQRFK